MSKPKMLPVIEAYQQLGEWAEIVPLSAKTSLNVDRLRDLVFARLTEHEGAYDEDFVTDQSLRHLAAEIVREKILELRRLLHSDELIAVTRLPVA